MSYIKQIFEKGQTLMAEDLNKMSEGIVSKCEIVEVNELPKIAQPESCYVYNSFFGINNINGIELNIISVDTYPANPIEFVESDPTMYYIRSEKILAIYGDINQTDEDNTKKWTDFGLEMGDDFGGYINSLEEATNPEVLYIVITPPVEADPVDTKIIYRHTEPGGDYYWISDDGNIGKNPSNEELGGAPIIVYNVYNVPEIGNGYLYMDPSSYAVSFILYYEGSSKSLKAYVDNFSLEFGGGEDLGLSVGWMDAAELANLLGLPLLGAFSDESELPADKPEIWLAYIAKDNYRYYIHDEQGRHELISSRNINEHVDPPHLYEHYIHWNDEYGAYNMDFSYTSSESTVPLYTFMDSLVATGNNLLLPAHGYYYEDLGHNYTEERIKHQVLWIVIEDGALYVINELFEKFNIWNALNTIKNEDSSFLIDKITRTRGTRQIY